MAKVRAIKGFEHLTDDEVLDILDSLKMFAAITYYQPTDKNESEDEK